MNCDENFIILSCSRLELQCNCSVHDHDVDLLVFIGCATPQVVGSGLPLWRPRFSPRAVHVGF